MLRALMSLAALALWAGSAAQGQPGSVVWLDQAPVAWNHPETSLPPAPVVQDAAGNLIRCRETERPPTLAVDRAVRAGGWTLFGPAQVFASTTVVMAMADVDGMCRPLRYQAFVFVDGRLAGTLSPLPMDSRTDGALIVVRLFRGAELVAEFARYAPTDPLCCPSRTSTVTYRIERTPRGPLVSPVSITTSPARS